MLFTEEYDQYVVGHEQDSNVPVSEDIYRATVTFPDSSIKKIVSMTIAPLECMQILLVLCSVCN